MSQPGRHKRRWPPSFPFFALSPSSMPDCRALSSIAPSLDTSYPLMVTERLGTPPDFSIAVVVHPLGEPLAAPLLAFLGPHLTFLPLSPWCRTRATSSATTVPAPLPSNATAQCCPTAPPTGRYGVEPRLRSSCPAHPPFSRGALAQDLSTHGRPLRRPPRVGRATPKSPRPWAGFGPCTV
jgi:hypothetical protein